MEIVSPKLDKVRRPILKSCMIAISYLVIACSTILVVNSLWKHPKATLNIERIEPRSLDQIFEVNHMINVKYRMHNPTDTPLSVKSIRTSCSCAVVQTDKRVFPLTIAPGQSALFTLQASTRPDGPAQTFSMLIDVARPGQAPTSLREDLTLRVHDRLKANPSEIVVLEATPGQKVNHKVALFTHSSPNPITHPTLRVSDPDRISAKFLPTVSDDSKRILEDFKAHFEIAVTITPPPHSQNYQGRVDVLNGNEIEVSIPLKVSQAQNFRLSQDQLEIDTLPGELLSRRLFYEGINPGWQDLKLTETPDWASVTIGQFDARSKTLDITIRTPDASKRIDTSLILSAGESSHIVKIPLIFRD
ncbi:DUF1573 domain-containing protein [Singulisphaera sp. PoT]|uniref:DUF1573 domain-containing protein n=1 Tax=Singulisphaera sp. PoT TaxID=3411797 RepID=UPI003BF47C00